MSFDIIDAGENPEQFYTLESNKNLCRNCKDDLRECNDIIDMNTNLWNLDHVYKNSDSHICYAPEPLENWWKVRLTDPATNLPANEESVAAVRHEMELQRQNAMLRERIIK
jgi:hypothetical protein